MNRLLNTIPITTSIMQLSVPLSVNTPDNPAMIKPILMITPKYLITFLNNNFQE